MNEILLLTKGLMYGISAFSLYKAFYLLINRKITGYVFFIPVFVLFYVMPGLLDDITGLGFNKNYKYIIEATENLHVNIFYTLYVSVLLLVFMRHSKYLMKKNTSVLEFETTRIIQVFHKIFKKFNVLLWVVILSPLFYIIFYQGLDQYYSIYLNRNFFYEAPEYHSTISKFVLIGVLAVAFMITSILINRKYYKKDATYLIPVLIFFLILLMWVHGKRSIVANYLLVQFVLIFISKVFSFRKLFISLASVLVLFTLFISFYGKGISSNKAQTYYMLRTDFSRDYTVKFAYYNDIVLGRNIIPNKFDTFKFNLLFFVPRSYWPNKPQPYAVYFTNSAFGNFGKDVLYGWGLTTSIFAEFISNMGILGLIFAPLLIMFIFFKESKSVNPVFKLLSIVVGTLLLLVQPVSFMILILIYVFLLLRGNRKLIFIK